jgi:hypothetical protein
VTNPGLISIKAITGKMASDPPKVLISYSRDSPQNVQRVLELANRLRGDGIDCTIDQYVATPQEGWPLWVERQIRNSDFVLMVCTETYYKQVMGMEEAGKGLGVRWEGQLIYQHLKDSGPVNTKFIPVLLKGGSPSFVPAPLQSTGYYFVDTADGYESLYRLLTNQPRTIKTELGKMRSLPHEERRSAHWANLSMFPICRPTSYHCGWMISRTLKTLCLPDSTNPWR